MNEKMITFEKKLREDPELASRVTELRKLPPKEAQEAITAIAGELGIELTEDDFAQIRWQMENRAEAELSDEEMENRAKAELSDEEMENVSGGVFWSEEDADDGHERRCVIPWYHEWSCCLECGCLNVEIAGGYVKKGLEWTIYRCSRCKAIWHTF